MYGLLLEKYHESLESKLNEEQFQVPPGDERVSEFGIGSSSRA